MQTMTREVKQQWCDRLLAMAADAENLMDQDVCLSVLALIEAGQKVPSDLKDHLIRVLAKDQSHGWRLEK